MCGASTDYLIYCTTTAALLPLLLLSHYLLCYRCCLLPVYAPTIPR